MTSEAKELQAGRELDRLIDEMVLGCHPGGVDTSGLADSDATSSAVPPYSTDITYALPVIDWLRERWSGSCSLYVNDSGWECWGGDSIKPIYLGRGKTAPLAICRAALAAVGIVSLAKSS